MCGTLVFAIQAAPDHNFFGHLECPRRVEAVAEELAAIPELAARGTQLRDVATISEATLQAVHPAAYLHTLRERCEALAGPSALADPDDPDGPTYATPTSYEDALRAASTSVALVEAVVSSTAPLAGLSASRPPGHHATAAGGPLGFCLLNSVAVAARHAQARLGLARVAVLDWDVHHGNGTQDIFYADPSVLFIDMHRSGVWPGSGAIDETGTGPGEGATINVPLPPGAGHAAALAAFERVVAPALRRFRPDLVLVSAGFDAHWRDPLETLQFQSATYHALSAGVRRLAVELCGGRCVLVLEGGYHCEALAESVAEAARGLVGLEPATAVLPPEQLPLREPSEEVQRVLGAVQRVHGL